jgi:hypothetical protein
MFNTGDKEVLANKKLIIDADSLLYQACYTNNDGTSEEIINSFKAKANNIFMACGHLCDSYIMLFTKGSFRYELYPEYKQNRKDKEVHVHFSFLVDWVKSNYNTYTDDYYEADDLVGILNNLYPNSVIACIDHDIYQIEGLFYNYHYNRSRLEVVDSVRANRQYYELMFGDVGDNIKVFTEKLNLEIKEKYGLRSTRGMGEKAVERVLEGCVSHIDYLRRLVDVYTLQFGKGGKNKLRLIKRLIDIKNHIAKDNHKELVFLSLNILELQEPMNFSDFTYIFPDND